MLKNRKSRRLGALSPEKDKIDSGDCRDAGRRAFLREAGAFRHFQTAAIKGDAEAVHQLRIAITRLRAAALFFSPFINDQAWPFLDMEFGWINSVLGKARDCDVMIELSQRKHYRHWASSSFSGFERARDKAYRKLGRKLNTARYRRLIAKLEAEARGGVLFRGHDNNATPSAEKFSRQRLRQWRSTILKQGSRLKSLRQKRLHHLRICCKQYRYMIAILQRLSVPLSPDDLSFAQTARQAQRQLGGLRDLRRLRKAADDHPPGYRKRKRRLIQHAADLFLKHSS
jgi:CHAD domain-containing protein